MIVYYSGCGNSRWVALTLAGRLQERLTFLPDTSADISLQDGEAIGFVFPVYAWAPPRLVLEFVRRMQLTHHPSYVWFACTCGDEGAFTRQVFSRALRKAGLNLDACFCLQMPETYIAFPGFALDTPANAQRKINSVRNDLPRIAELINHRERQHFEMIWGIFPLTKTYVLQPLFYRFIITDRHFRVTDECIGCGRCAKECPLHNIRIEDQHPVWQGNCTHCMSCYHHCPKNAIHYAHITPGKGQYYFKEESLKIKNSL